MKIEIGSHQAKARLSELLRGVLQGHRYTITLRGKAVAELVPAAPPNAADVALAVQQMKQFMATQPPILGIDTKALKEEGRD